MTTYSDNKLKTKYLDPRVYVPNLRATFDLDLSESAYMPNMKLGFVGVTLAAGTHAYNKLLGAGAIIRNIRLMDGKQVLSQLNEAQFYKGFLNQKRHNAEAEAYDSNQQKNQIGLSIEGSTNRVARTAPVDFANVNQLGAAANATVAGTLDLMEYFPLLKKMYAEDAHLPTSVFKNLRVVIEYNTNKLNQIVYDTTQELTSLRPILIVDALTDPVMVAQMNKNLKPIAWKEVEHDQFIIPQAATLDDSDAVIQRLTVKLNGFNNKTLDEMLIVKELSDANLLVSGGNIVGFGKWASQSCYDQVIQFRINGRNILPRQGLTGDNERLATVVDTYGDMAAYPGSNYYQTKDIDTVMRDGLDMSGQADYIGIYVGKQINDLQVNFNRTHVKDGVAGPRATNATLIGHVYGAVEKQLVYLQNDLFQVEYVQSGDM